MAERIQKLDQQDPQSSQNHDHRNHRNHQDNQAQSPDQHWDIIIRGGERRFSVDWRGLLKSGDLIRLLVRRNFVTQYKQTVLGPAWAVIQPLCTTAVFSVFFGGIAGLGAEGVPDFMFYLCGTVLWNLFQNCLTRTSDTFIGNAAIFGKVYFPRLVMPVTTALSQFVAFFIQFALMLAFLLYFVLRGSGVSPNRFILLTPALLLQCALLGLGCGMILSALTTKYRDLRMLVGFGVNLWSYSSPVAYDMFSRAPLAPGGRLYSLYMLNPVTPLLNCFRCAFLGTGFIDWKYYAISWLTTLLLAAAGVALFSRVERSFMDTI